MPNAPRICTDRVLPRDEMRFRATVRRNGRTRAISPIGKTWMNGSTLRVRFMGGTAAQQTTVREQAAWWTAVANLTLEFGTAADAEIRVAFNESLGAWSYVGTDARGISLSEPTMNLGFMDGGTAGHEFGHAIGLSHEHQSPAGGIQWKEDIVIREMAKSPNFWSEAKTRHNILRKYGADQIHGTAFDRASIMLYFFPGSWTMNGIGTDANEVLSPLDKAFVASAKMYPGRGATTSTATELVVNASRRTPASIGKFGEEDLFRFTAPSDGLYTIDTRGPTDVYMKLFGPNSETALIAEDDDSGVETNARMTRALIAGDYYVQIRHYNRAGGMGPYSMRVTRL